MINEIVAKIKNAVSGERAFNLVGEIANFHRIQASTGYREAAQHVQRRLAEEGLEVKIRSYPADGRTWFFTSRMFKEWDCRGAALHLAAPARVLADFKTNAMSIIQRSYPCDFRDNPLEIVLLDQGSNPKAYENLDLQGKLIFVRDHFQDYLGWAVKDNGAVGIITDYLRPMEGVRTPFDLYDTLNYTSFWWKHTPDEPQVFGFVLTPRQGDWLAQVCLEMRAEHAKDPSKSAYPCATGYVDANLYDGEIEVVEALLPGEKDEEVLITAHLCHPRSSANDNASGVGAAMEAIKTLKDLTSSGALPALRRSIRVIFIPEFTGTYAYIHDRGEERVKIKAGINLDMVGGRQSHGYGPLTLSGLPHAMPSFIVDLAALVLDEVRKTVPGGNKDAFISMFNSAITDIETGSDHLVLSDPTINIPAVMLGQWPDLTYHTSADTMEVVDPFILHKSASICAAYAYLLANLGEEDVPVILNKRRERFVGDLAARIHAALENENDPNCLYEVFQHYIAWYQAGNRDLLRFFDGEGNSRMGERVEKENARLADLAASLWAGYTQDFAPDYSYIPGDVPEAYDYIPVRKFTGPIFHLEDYALEDAQKMQACQDYIKYRQAQLQSGFYFESMVQFYIDGRRTLWEIAREAMLETREGSVETVDRYVQLLISLDLVEKKE